MPKIQFQYSFNIMPNEKVTISERLLKDISRMITKLTPSSIKLSNTFMVEGEGHEKHVSATCMIVLQNLSRNINATNFTEIAEIPEDLLAASLNDSWNSFFINSRTAGLLVLKKVRENSKCSIEF